MIHLSEHRFLYLIVALMVLLVGYPHFGPTAGGLISLSLLVTGVHAVRARRRALVVAILLAAVAAAVSVRSLVTGSRGDPLVEFSFFLFYAFCTVVIFAEVLRSERISGDTLLGVVSVYLLIGVSFGNLYDFIETLRPGSFVMGDVGSLGFQKLIYYSFMTLTTVGYGDITPATTAAQSMAIIEAVMGVLYVAVMIARMVSIHSRD